MIKIFNQLYFSKYIIMIVRYFHDFPVIAIKSPPPLALAHVPPACSAAVLPGCRPESCRAGQVCSSLSACAAWLALGRGKIPTTTGTAQSGVLVVSASHLASLSSFSLLSPLSSLSPVSPNELKHKNYLPPSPLPRWWW